MKSVPDRLDRPSARSSKNSHLQEVIGQAPFSESASRACLAGLWLLHNYLDQSHTLSQAIADSNGSFWHGIMHRREPDYGNAKYWFRRVGSHPVLDRLAGELHKRSQSDRLPDELRPHAAGSLSAAASAEKWTRRVVRAGTFDPMAFVDLCQEASRPAAGEELRAWCRWVGWLEWQLLFDYCFQEAITPRKE
ncbi:MAG: hypothetical protein KatS3mg110_1359 [Pirellulaceae bacterium]|nr:MAG: hypothetical protein KatS3mg110_1359 [Pirellulaceae bacterium]